MPDDGPFDGPVGGPIDVHVECQSPVKIIVLPMLKLLELAANSTLVIAVPLGRDNRDVGAELFATEEPKPGENLLYSRRFSDILQGVDVYHTAEFDEFEDSCYSHHEPLEDLAIIMASDVEARHVHKQIFLAVDDCGHQGDACGTLEWLVNLFEKPQCAVILACYCGCRYYEITARDTIQE